MEDTEKPVSIHANLPRKTWKTKFDYIFNLIGMVVGLGNVWRFPYLCYKNGGGAFLIPYFLLIATVVWPLLILESALGQMVGRSSVRAWNIVPLMRGIGYTCPLLLIYANVFYPIILTWALRWLYASFSSSLSWAFCGNSWNSDTCVPLNGLDVNASGVGNLSASTLSTLGTNISRYFSPVEEFWRNEILGLSPGLEHPNGIKWDLLLCLTIVWILAYFSIWKGIGWTSKVVYVTATLPFAMLTVVLVRGLTLDGAAEGVFFYLKPNITKLAEIEIWADAASQVMYSFVVCVGAVTTLSGYNKYQHNFYRDSIVLVLANAGTSFMAGFAIFSVLGHLAQTQNATIEAVAESGPGLVFVIYPTALSLLPLPQLWCAMFFVMLLFLGFDGLFIVQETLNACIKDLYPRIFVGKWRREIIVAVVALSVFLPAIAMVTRGGMYVFVIFDRFAITGWCMFFIGFCELLTIGWIYGGERMCDNIKLMLGRDILRRWFITCWKFIAPVIVIVIMVYSMVKHENLTYDRTYIFPWWANLLGFCLALSSVLWIPGIFLFTLWKAEGNSIQERFKTSIRTPDAFIPKDIYMDAREEEVAALSDMNKLAEL